ncbi:arylamine N-acetyltransferase family protein [Marinomonas atlantica]|uniref:arylamine N-acetyltransferase family protein n=1 Tax=Marinomonas atlantica TaxID=1806668 RepID=UPI00082A5323|nr:arylamine N-acetyltransferase [Marinomonas atlantica]MCO4784935.1 arylamine N-acetyltransferase [Marinomonas atlantica]
MTYTDYLKALNLARPQEPNLDFLNAFTVHHIERFTFNNLAVLLHKDLSLDSQSILKKVVQRGAGGYCFEHNKIAYEALAEWGFNVRLVLAKVINNNERPVPRTHRLTIVECAGETYLVDVGFGATCPILPIAFNRNTPQKAGLEYYQIRATNHNEYELLLLKEGEPFILYRFDLAQYSDADCEVGHFYSHKHASAVFVNNVVVSQKTPTETFSLANQRFKHATESSESVSIIDSPEKLCGILRNTFDLCIEPELCEFLYTHHIAPKLEITKN